MQLMSLKMLKSKTISSFCYCLKIWRLDKLLGIPIAEPELNILNSYHCSTIMLCAIHNYNYIFIVAFFSLHHSFVPKRLYFKWESKIILILFISIFNLQFQDGITRTIPIVANFLWPGRFNERYLPAISTIFFRLLPYRLASSSYWIDVVLRWPYWA